MPRARGLELPFERRSNCASPPSLPPSSPRPSTSPSTRAAAAEPRQSPLLAPARSKRAVSPVLGPRSTLRERLRDRYSVPQTEQTCPIAIAAARRLGTSAVRTPGGGETRRGLAPRHALHRRVAGVCTVHFHRSERRRRPPRACARRSPHLSSPLALPRAPSLLGALGASSASRGARRGSTPPGRRADWFFGDGSATRQRRPRAGRVAESFLGARRLSPRLEEGRGGACALPAVCERGASTLACRAYTPNARRGQGRLPWNGRVLPPLDASSCRARVVDPGDARRGHRSARALSFLSGAPCRRFCCSRRLLVCSLLPRACSSLLLSPTLRALHAVVSFVRTMRRFSFHFFFHEPRRAGVVLS